MYLCSSVGRLEAKLQIESRFIKLFRVSFMFDMMVVLLIASYVYKSIV